ncbi:MAG: DUF362 domain-containing protein [archaeon]|jgi:hypothetical protein
MTKVYFTKIDSYSKTKEINKATLTLFKKIQSEEKILDFSKPIPIKVHFGEDKCTTYIESKKFESLIDYFKDNSRLKNTPVKPNIFFTETNALYKGKRTTKESHTNLAKEHGFTQLPIIIADGEMGENYSEVKIKKPPAKHFDSCKIGKVIADSEQLIVIAHFKGHMMAGFGGAIKQLAMGCAARGGKLAMHAQSKPILNPLECKKCHTCVKNCPANACIIDTLVPHIDYSKCIGCAKCIAVCPYSAMKINWASTLPGDFEEKLAEYAYAAQKGKKVIYISFALNITKECDCMGTPQKTIAKDIGVLASIDPVALDTACLDLLKKSEGKKIFRGEHALEHAEQLGFGSKKYELVEVNLE